MSSQLLRLIPVGLVTFIIYIVFTGSITPYDIVTGVAVAALTAALFSHLLVENTSKSLNPIRLLWLIIYALYYFTIIEMRAHLDVAKRIIHPKMPLNPGIVRVPYNVGTEYAIVTIANSITNTPGTVVVDLDEDKKVFYVHWIDVKGVEPETTYKNISMTFEKYAKKIFD